MPNPILPFREGIGLKKASMTLSFLTDFQEEIHKKRKSPLRLEDMGKDADSVDTKLYFSENKMKETANPDRIQAAADAFEGERLRWLVGKGDVLVRRGELTQERLQELMEQTVKEEIDRSHILREIHDGPATITELAKATKMEKEHILENLLALIKWNQVEIVGKENREYIYARKEL